MVLEPFFARRARIPGLEAAGTQHDSPNLYWRILVSSADTGPLEPARNFGDVGINFRFLVGPSWVDVAEKSPPMGQFHGHVRGGLLRNLQLPKSEPRKIPHFKKRSG